MNFSFVLGWLKALMPLYFWAIVAFGGLLMYSSPPALLSAWISPPEWQALIVLASPLVTWLVVALLDFAELFEFDNKGGRTNLPIAWILFTVGCFDMIPSLVGEWGIQATTIMLPVLVLVTVGAVIKARMKPGAFRAAIDREMNLLRYGRTWAPSLMTDHSHAALANTARASASFKQGDIIFGTDKHYMIDGEAKSSRLLRPFVRPAVAAPMLVSTYSQTGSVVGALRAAKAAGGGQPSLLRMDLDGHIIVTSGSGGGKTVSFVVPVMLDYSAGSVVCIDPKGEVHEITARARRELGHEVYRLAPRDVNSDSLDVLGWIDPGQDDFWNHCKTVAEWMFPPDTGGEDGASFFNGMARGAFVVVLAHKLAVWHEAKQTDSEATPPSLVDVYKFLVRAPEAVAKDFDRIHQDLEKSDPNRFGAATLPILQEASSYAGMEPEKTWPNAQSTIQKNISWLGDPAVACVVSGTADPRGEGRGFSTDVVRGGKASIYMCLPLSVMQSTPGLAKLIVGSLMNSIIEATGKINGKTLFMIDEMQALGKFKILHETGLNQARGYGVTLAGIVQSPAALNAAAGDNTFETWTDSAKLQLYFGISGYDLAEKLSSTIGETTVEVRNYSGNINKQRGQILGADSGGVSVSVERHSRRLLTASEILNLPREYGIALRGIAVDDPEVKKWPMIVGTAFYKNHRELVRKADESSFERKEVSDDFDLDTSQYQEVPVADTQKAANTSPEKRDTGEWAGYDPEQELKTEAKKSGNTRLQQIAEVIERIDEAGECSEEDQQILERALATPASYRFDGGGMDDLELEDIGMSFDALTALEQAEIEMAQTQSEIEKIRSAAVFTSAKPGSATMEANDDAARIHELLMRLTAPMSAEARTEAA